VKSVGSAFSAVNALVAWPFGFPAHEIDTIFHDRWLNMSDSWHDFPEIRLHAGRAIFRCHGKEISS
jgi:hypothetical protein